MTNPCRLCNQQKPELIDNMRKYCDFCRIEMRIKINDRMREYMRIYQHDPDVWSKRLKYRNKTNVKEHHKAYMQLYRQKPMNKIKIREYQRRYKKKYLQSPVNRAKYNEYQRNYQMNHYKRKKLPENDKDGE